MTFATRVYLVLLLLCTVWCGGILLAPLLAASAPEVSSVLYRCYEPICHQLDARSFHIGGEKYAVCARCSSIYLGFFVALAVYPLLFRPGPGSIPQRTWIAVAVVPMLLDVFLSLFGFHQSTLFTRAVSGGVFGLVIPFFVLPVLIEAITQLRSQFLSRGGSFHARKAQ
jgi:uncharacterized membrane protein